MRTTTPARPSAGPSTAPGSSRSPAATTARRPATCGCSRPPRMAHRWTGAPILTHCEGGTGALNQVQVLGDLGRARRARRPEPRRQGRRPGLPPRAARDRGLRRVRRLVPLGRPRQRHADAAGLGARGRPHRAASCSAWTPPARATTTRTAGRPGSPGCSTDSRARWAPAASTPTTRRRLFVDNPARAYAFAVDRDGRRVMPPMSRRPSRSPAGPDRAAPAAGRPAHERRRVARAAVLVRGRDRRGRSAGEFGPADLDEMLDDAVDLALRDQEVGRASMSSATARCAAPASSRPSSTST